MHFHNNFSIKEIELKFETVFEDFQRIKEAQKINFVINKLLKEIRNNLMTWGSRILIGLVR